MHGVAPQALANAKIALLSTAVFAPAAAGMIGNAFLSKHFKERNFHGGVPVLVSGIAFLALPSAISHGGVAGGFVTLIIAATGAWAVHPPLWCADTDTESHHRAARTCGSAHTNGGRHAQVLAGFLPGGPSQVSWHRLLQCVRHSGRVCGTLLNR